MIKVFLVEDEIVIREALQKMIPWNEYGFELAGDAKDGELALPLIRKLKPDILITDIKMPFMDGLTLSRIVRKELPETKIIIVSGYDDFEYARQAISLGVEQYLLKPVSKVSFLQVLEEIRIKFEKENEVKKYMQKFQNEIREYEKNSLRDFFELLVMKQPDLKNICEKAESLNMDILAQSYNIVLFTIGTSDKHMLFEDSYSQDEAELQDRIHSMFAGEPEYILFRNQIFNYAVLVKGDTDQITSLTDACINRLTELLTVGRADMDWYVCNGQEVQRLSHLHLCYKEAMKRFAFRYLEHGHVFSEDRQSEQIPVIQDAMSLSNLDVMAVNSETVYSFLCNAFTDEIPGFIRNYLKQFGVEALKSRMFRQYILLNIHFTSASFIMKLGEDKELLDESLREICSNRPQTDEEQFQIIENMLRTAIDLREETSRGRYHSVVKQAVLFMKEHFHEDNLTLNDVACAVNVSSNHFSALFSQTMKQTFIEYLTGLRMQKAKELLRCTDHRSGEIALEVGYKDAHYFSFLFKKTQGMSPKEYRQKGERRYEA